MTRTTLSFAAEHPVFAGHFPGQPIVPGVLLLDHARLAIQEACGQRCTGLSTAKFHSPVSPGEIITVDYEVGPHFVSFEITSDARKIADGRFSL